MATSNHLIASLLGLLALGVSACSTASDEYQYAGADASGTDASDTGSPAPYGSFGGGACGQCVAQLCSTDISSCNGAPDCAAYLQCVGSCPILNSQGTLDPECAGRCWNATVRDASAEMATVAQCQSSAQAACHACGSASGADGGDGGENPILRQSCPPVTDVTPCYACEDHRCCHTYASCQANADCEALERCLKDCNSGISDDAGSPDGGVPPGSSCDLMCGEAHPAGLVDWAPRLTCLLLFCAVACENPPMLPLDPCSQCTNQYCANEYANLSATPDGFLYGACVAVCPSGAHTCTAGCAAQYPSIAAASSALATCISAQCPYCN